MFFPSHIHGFFEYDVYLSNESGRFQPVKLGVFTEDLASLFRSLIERTGIEVRTAMLSVDI